MGAERAHERIFRHFLPALYGKNPIWQDPFSRCPPQEKLLSISNHHQLRIKLKIPLEQEFFHKISDILYGGLGSHLVMSISL